ncbi:hypothetical protein Pse7367_1910 [Thalassoporum mexicanum PCC 7367]|uniref:SH3-like domain-containing protein n=1 Tax=Thalassoporum mexicanum TaxID=3457544 RepID=UPI00029FE010|nr:SH3-like domain-containing protein [Pseudanabaena sp. PCC 7367]AFY70186.1 hypothetical protein Pse7367_1910 [Pseudanabaena sp. PCC 7367]
MDSLHQRVPHSHLDKSSIDTDEVAIARFEKHIISMHNLMIAKGQLPSMDPVRRAAEEVDGMFTTGQLPARIPNSLKQRLPAYGERRLLAIEKLFCEMGFFTEEELAQGSIPVPAALGQQPPIPFPYKVEKVAPNENNFKFNVGDKVKVESLPKSGHVRTPVYILGKQGTIAQIQGNYPNPEEVAHLANPITVMPLYLVRFELADLWGDACLPANAKDTLCSELYEHWLTKIN